MAKSKLKAVDPKEAAPSKPKILIYGKPGVKKTWISLDWPSTYYVDIEGGANLPAYTDKLKKSGGVYFGQEQGSQNFETVIEEVKTLATEKHKYKTLVLDSGSKIYALAIAKEAERLGEKNGYGADKRPAIAHMRTLVSWLDRLDMNVIIICHEKSEWGLNASGERVEIGKTFDCWEKLEYELHLCLNILESQPNSTAKVKKTRLGSFPKGSAFPWTYDDFATRFGKDVIEKEAIQLVLASAEQVAEIKRLVDTVKLPEGQIDKWYNAANCESWEDMDADKLTKIIGYININFINKAQGEAA